MSILPTESTVWTRTAEVLGIPRLLIAKPFQCSTQPIKPKSNSSSTRPGIPWHSAPDSQGRYDNEQSEMPRLSSGRSLVVPGGSYVPYSASNARRRREVGDDEYREYPEEPRHSQRHEGPAKTVQSFRPAPRDPWRANSAPVIGIKSPAGAEIPSDWFESPNTQAWQAPKPIPVDENALQSGRPIVALQPVSNDENQVAATAVFLVNAPAQVVWETIQDLACYPKWIDGLSVNVQADTVGGSGKAFIVDSQLQAFPLAPRIKYRIRQFFSDSAREPFYSVWDLDTPKENEEFDLKTNRGSWRIVSESDEVTRVEYRIETATRIRLGKFLQGVISRQGAHKATQWVKKQSLKRWEEKKAGGASPSSAAVGSANASTSTSTSANEANQTCTANVSDKVAHTRGLPSSRMSSVASNARGGSGDLRPATPTTLSTVNLSPEHDPPRPQGPRPHRTPQTGCTHLPPFFSRFSNTRIGRWLGRGASAIKAGLMALYGFIARTLRGGTSPVAPPAKIDSRP